MNHYVSNAVDACTNNAREQWGSEHTLKRSSPEEETLLEMRQWTQDARWCLVTSQDREPVDGGATVKPHLLFSVWKTPPGSGGGGSNFCNNLLYFFNTVPTKKKKTEHVSIFILVPLGEES